jgi:tRNA nucleotidyltransferase (CCA-adding enzyme)
MKKYKVGGCVRDKLLDYDYTEIDWVVVGSTPQDLLDQGFLQVGSGFPVFLDPKEKQEHALARTERKTGIGYKGFEFAADENVTLEEDLSRRDLTINAMAEDSYGNIIDPYGGQKDLSQKILRHVSDAFSEDPLRVLRVARFAARYHHLGFKVADETLLLMTHMSGSGELGHLTAERVWVETNKALQEKSPSIYIEVLRQCNALSKLFPEINRLFSIPQSMSKINAGMHTLLSLDYSAALDNDPSTRFAVLIGNIGKSIDTAYTGQHNEDVGIKIVHDLCDRLKVPNRYREIATAVTKYRSFCHNSRNLDPSAIIKVLKGVGSFKASSNLIQFICCCEADAKAIKESRATPYDAGIWLIEVFNEIQLIDNKALMKKGFSGAELGQEIDRCREKIIAKLIKR